MKKSLFLLTILIVVFICFGTDKSIANASNQPIESKIPDFLRQGISVNKHTLEVAIEMHMQGWVYVMPKPKSIKAKRGSRDGRTTWWCGYWHNQKTRVYSKSEPRSVVNGFYCGDGLDSSKRWQKGGTPSTPSDLEWLLSSVDEVKPY